MTESTMHLEISTGVGKIEQELFVGGAGFYKNTCLASKISFWSFGIPVARGGKLSSKFVLGGTVALVPPLQQSGWFE